MWGFTEGKRSRHRGATFTVKNCVPEKDGTEAHSIMFISGKKGRSSEKKRGFYVGD